MSSADAAPGQTTPTSLHDSAHSQDRSVAGCQSIEQATEKRGRRRSIHTRRISKQDTRHSKEDESGVSLEAFLKESRQLQPDNSTADKRPIVRQPSSRMSLFHLFSKPKVEKSRGYAESGLNQTAPTPTFKEANASSTSFSFKVQPPAASRPPSRATSGMGFRRKEKPEQKVLLPTSANIQPPQHSPARPQPPPQLERPQTSYGKSAFTPPPLFQAYPQSTKHGLLEVSSVDPYLARGGGKRNHVPVDLPRKIFVLVTSGYLLQYSESGTSDRLPEKILQLGKQSAAFASDLIPGKHYVLQISQAVDKQGAVIPNSGSLLSRLGLRSASTKRQTTNFLLVMPDGDEMSYWMDAIRKEIEVLGGPKAPTASLAPSSRRNAGEHSVMQLTERQQHRLNAKRASELPGSHPSSPMLAASSPGSNSPAPPTPVSSPQIKEEGGEEPQPTPEREQKVLLNDSLVRSPEIRARRHSDTPSVGSSRKPSMEQKQSDELRNSTSIKRRSFSSSSQTIATAVETKEESRKDSMNSSSNSTTSSPPRSQLTMKQSLDSLRDRGLASVNYRNTISQSSFSRRRSALPRSSMAELELRPPTHTNAFAQQQEQDAKTAAPVESPVAGRSSPFAEREPVLVLPPTQYVATRLSPPRKRTSLAAQPSMQSLVEVDERADSKLGTPPSKSSEERTSTERPESVVGDLPPPSTWAPKTSPLKRISFNPEPPPGQAQTVNRRISLQAPPKPPVDMPVRKRRSTPSFSLPLRINPSSSPNQPSARNSRRYSQNANLFDEPSTGDTPVVHTLTAHGPSDPSIASPEALISAISPLPASASSSEMDFASASSRLSVSARTPPLPLLSSSPPHSSPDSTRLSPSSSPEYQTGNATLRRPKSLQVNSDRAPFLSSMRSTTPTGTSRATFTPPIRGLRPSRSPSGGMARVDEDSVLTSTDPLKPIMDAVESALPEQEEDDVDIAPNIPRLPRSMPTTTSPFLPPTSALLRSFPTPKGFKGIKMRASMSTLEVGVPLGITLPPPAPPPKAPLPELPPSSRGNTPEPRAANTRPSSRSSKAYIRPQSSAGIMRPGSASSGYMRPPSAASFVRPASSAGLGISVS